MDERTETLVRRAREVLYNAGYSHLAMDLTVEIERLSALVEDSPKWMERPSEPGYWLVKRHRGENRFWKINQLEIDVWDDYATANDVIEVYGPIPKGTPDAT